MRRKANWWALLATILMFIPKTHRWRRRAIFYSWIPSFDGIPLVESTYITKDE